LSACIYAVQLDLKGFSEDSYNRLNA